MRPNNRNTKADSWECNVWNLNCKHGTYRAYNLQLELHLKTEIDRREAGLIQCALTAGGYLRGRNIRVLGLKIYVKIAHNPNMYSY